MTGIRYAALMTRVTAVGNVVFPIKAIVRKYRAEVITKSIDDVFVVPRKPADPFAIGVEDVVAGAEGNPFPRRVVQILEIPRHRSA